MVNRLKITVFCSASDLEPRYVEPASQLLRQLAQEGYDLVWGGSNTGLMKVAADMFRAEGSKLYGVTIPHLKSVARADIDDLTIADTLSERKQIMIESGDAILILVGGMGTLDEATHAMELKKHSLITKSIIFFNTEGFYNHLEKHMESMKNNGFVKTELASFLTSPQEVLDSMKEPPL